MARVWGAGVLAGEPSSRLLSSPRRSTTTQSASRLTAPAASSARPGIRRRTPRRRASMLHRHGEPSLCRLRTMRSAMGADRSRARPQTLAPGPGPPRARPVTVQACPLQPVGPFQPDRHSPRRFPLLGRRRRRRRVFSHRRALRGPRRRRSRRSRHSHLPHRQRRRRRHSRRRTWRGPRRSTRSKWGVRAGRNCSRRADRSGARRPSGSTRAMCAPTT